MMSVRHAVSLGYPWAPSPRCSYLSVSFGDEFLYFKKVVVGHVVAVAVLTNSVVTKSWSTNRIGG